ncbi:MAG: kelch repeat-containing protein [Planctomycetota bacterium]
MIASRELGVSTLLGTLALGMILVATACSGGGVSLNNNQNQNLVAGVANTTPVVAPNGAQAVRVDFTLNGPPNAAFVLLFKFFDDPMVQPGSFSGMIAGQADALVMTEVNQAFADMFNPPLTLFSDSVLPANGSLTGTYFWNAGADLGFVPSNICVVVDVESPDGGITSEVDGVTCGILVEASVLPMGSTGDNIGPIIPGMMTQGSTGHSANVVFGSDGSDRILIAGGETQEVGMQNFIAVDSVNRFNFDIAAGTHSLVTAASGGNARSGHASAFYYDAASQQVVLITGGQDGDGTPTSTTDSYSSALDTVTAGPNMGMARVNHTACWLADNTILIVGGDGAAGTSAEIYDPNANTFMPTTAPLFGRANHTCTLLPDGRALIAGGQSTSTALTPLAAEIFDPVAGTWSSTGTFIDRYDHTATLLVNGVVYLVGGHAVTNDAVLGTAQAYRTFDGDLPGGGTEFPAGFSPTSDFIAEARADHAATRLGSGAILITGGFMAGTPESSSAAAEVFLPNKLTDDVLGFFSAIDVDLVNSRARHTLTTVPSGAAINVGGVNGSIGALTALDSVESYAFSNEAPSATINSAAAVFGNLGDVPVNITVSDADGDCSFVFLQYSTDSGASYNFATLTNYADTVNIAPGSSTLHWNAAADGIQAGAAVTLRLIPVGGVFGAPAMLLTGF